MKLKKEKRMRKGKEKKQNLYLFFTTIIKYLVRLV